MIIAAIICHCLLFLILLGAVFLSWADLSRELSELRAKIGAGNLQPEPAKECCSSGGVWDEGRGEDGSESGG